MRILYSHRIQSRDGQSVHVEELVASLRALGHEVLVVGPGFYDKASFGGESRLVALIRSVFPSFLGELAELAYNVPAILRLRRAYRSFSPDLIYERYNLFFLAGVLLARWTGVKIFLEVNAPLAEERRHGGLRLKGLAARLERFVWRSADRVLAVTSVLKDAVVRQGVPRSRIEVVPNGIDLHRFTALAIGHQASAGAAVLGFVAFVRAWHGLDTVIAAMAEHPEPPLRLVVVGDGPALPSLRQQATTLNIAERVQFTGLAAHDQIPGLIGGFDIALQPMAVPYASPLKLFEYMAAGKAIVAPDQPNIREVLADGETALLFDPGNHGAMWHAICRLAADPALRDRLGAAARAEIVRRDYTWRANAQRVVALACSMR